MKKVFLLVMFLFLLLFSACSSWQDPGVPPNMPEKLRISHEQALAENLAIIKNDPNNIEAQFEVSFRYQLLGQYKNAIRAYQKTLELSPIHFVALNNLASLYEEVREYDQAAQYIKILYQNNQTNNEAIRDTVRILLKADDPDNATKALENFEKLSRSKNDPALSKMVSDLYQTIFDYRQNNGLR